MYQFLTLLCLSILTREALPCTQRDFGEESFVCVCDVTQCDYIPGEALPIAAGQFRVSKSSVDEFRLDEEVINIADSNVVVPDVEITLDTTVQYQTMIGFGGAFTDSAGLTMRTLSQVNQDNIMKTYFGPEGADYSVCRIPIAGSDFSTRPYSYDDVPGDVDLVNFALAYEDYEFKLPFIHKALGLTNRDLYLFGSPWSPPSWMKTNGMFNESGELLPEMWQPYANYIVKFVEAYESELGVSLWGLTPQNEPLSGFDPNWGWNTCGWSAEDSRDWIKTNLGPTLEANGMRRLKLMVHDFNRDSLVDYATTITADSEASQYVDGIAVHWYSDLGVGPDVLDDVHSQAEDKFILYTEACEGWDVASHEESVKLGSWARGQLYMTNIIEDCNHWSTGWVDWNIALDTSGGPNWAYNWVDSPIIINAANDEFFVQPTHSALAHFSRYVQRDSKRISYTNTDASGNLPMTAFLNPDGSVVVVLVNTGTSPINYGISDEVGSVFTRTLGSQTWETIVYLRD